MPPWIDSAESLQKGISLSPDQHDQDNGGNNNGGCDEYNIQSGAQFFRVCSFEKYLFFVVGIIIFQHVRGVHGIVGIESIESKRDRNLIFVSDFDYLPLIRIIGPAASIKITIFIINIEIGRLDGQFGKIIVGHFNFHLKGITISCPTENFEVGNAVTVPFSNGLFQTTPGVKT